MGTKIDNLQKCLDQVKEKLLLIQNERSKMNDGELPVKTKKRITDENFQKIIKLKNDDINAVLAMKNEILALNEGDDNFTAYKNNRFDDKITEMNKLFDDTFAIVDQMKRETELMMNNEDGSNKIDAICSIDANKSSESFESSEEGSNELNVIPDSRSNNDYIVEVFGKSLRKALASVILHQPNDPIEYLATFLHNYRQNEILNDSK